MLFVLEIPDKTFQRTMVNRQTVAAKAQGVLRASSPHFATEWCGEDMPFENYVFKEAKVRALPNEIMEILNARTDNG